MGYDLMKADSVDINPVLVLIVGCGNIAGGFDQARPPGSLPYTHAGAYKFDGRFHIAACVEPDERRRNEFMEACDIKVGFQSIDEVLHSCGAFDVISICSPTSEHGNHLETALRLHPKLIFCEKPVTTSVWHTQCFVTDCREANIPMAVNYTRRWDPDIIHFTKAIHTSQWGELRTVIGLYNKGILNNGSHMIDLLHVLLGPMNIVRAGVPVYDYFPDDPTIPVWLESEDGLSITLSCGQAADYAVFELQFVFSNGVLTMEDGGMWWRERCAVDSTLFKGYRKLEAERRREGQYPRAMINAVDNIYRSIRNGEPLASTGETALAAQRVCEQIRQLSYTGNKISE